MKSELPVSALTDENEHVVFMSSQTDLEMVVEDLAQKVNRPYLRTPCHKIISAARLVQQKRQEFLASVARGVAPNDSPEPPRRKYEQTHTLHMCFLWLLFTN